jgi:hypothetical protein
MCETRCKSLTSSSVPWLGVLSDFGSFGGVFAIPRGPNDWKDCLCFPCDPRVNPVASCQSQGVATRRGQSWPFALKWYMSESFASAYEVLPSLALSYGRPPESSRNDA